MPQSASYFEWTLTKKILFRFFFLFFILYIFFNPNGVFPGVDALFGIYIEPFHKLIPWFGKHVLHLSYDITVFTNGSGDTTYDYVTVLVTFILSVLGCLLWSILDRNRASYNRLYYWLTVFLRYYAAFTMLTYGFVKVFKLQFPSPSLNRLIQPYGNSSPMGLAWTFMGYSKGYNYFTGFAEVLGGVLLLFRRTSMAGAIVTMIVMGNVMAMNYSFDIPVKLLSTMVVVMCLFLLAKDSHRVIDFFFLNKGTEPGKIFTPPVRKRGLQIILIVFKIVLLAYTFIMVIYSSVSSLSQYGDAAPKPPLYGIYDVKTFVKNRDTILPLKTDTARWDKLVVNYAGSANIKMVNDSIKRFALETDTVKKEIVLYIFGDTLHKGRFAYTMPEKDMLAIKGVWKNDTFDIMMKKYDLNNFRLVSRGFNWINEYPFNR
jgi:flagellar basal body-associated protein FliL